MLSAALFARAARLVPEHWSRLCPESPVAWACEVQRTPMGEEHYLSVDAVPAEVLGCSAPDEDPAPAPAGPNGADDADPARPVWAAVPEQQPPEEGAADEACAPSQQQQQQRRRAPGCPPPHLYDLHVLYHHAYQAPCLFVRGYLADGRVLERREMDGDFRHWAEHARLAGGDSWSFMSPEVHPVTQQLGWLMLHPCHTAELMQLLLQAHDDGTHPAGREQGQGQKRVLSAGGLPPDAAYDVPDIDDLLSAEAGAAAPAPAVPAAQDRCRASPVLVPPGVSDAALLRYLEAWLRLVCPVVGLKVPLPLPGSNRP